MAGDFNCSLLRNNPSDKKFQKYCHIEGLTPALGTNSDPTYNNATSPIDYVLLHTIAINCSLSSFSCLAWFKESWMVENSEDGMCKIRSYFGHLANSYQSWKCSIESYFNSYNGREANIHSKILKKHCNHKRHYYNCIFPVLGRIFLMTKIAQDFTHSTIRILHHSTSWECVTSLY